MPTTRELIAAWREAERKATPGPWNAQGEGICCGLYSEPDHILIFDPDSTWADAQFIALSRNAARPLLDLLAECRDVLAVFSARVEWFDPKRNPEAHHVCCRANELLLQLLPKEPKE